MTCYVEPTAVGTSLIDMPLFLTPDRYVNVPLEKTYLAAYDGLPQRWKRVIMATMTIRIPDAKHDRLRRLAESQGISLNKLVDEWASMALAQFDAETRFNARAASGNARRGLALLDKLDQAFDAPRTVGKMRQAKK